MPDPWEPFELPEDVSVKGLHVGIPKVSKASPCSKPSPTSPSGIAGNLPVLLQISVTSLMRDGALSCPRIDKVGEVWCQEN